MALFKKKQEEEWVIDEDDYYEDTVEEPVIENPQKEIINTKRIHRKSKRDDFYDEDEEWLYEEGAKAKPIAKWKLIVPALLVSIICIGLLGYINTDFDNAGNAYIVGLEQHYERKYMKESDKVLEYLITISETLENDIDKLPSHYVEYSTKLKKEANKLESMTTSLSKYVGVPTDLDTYHTQILNFSLKAQEFLTTLLNSYNDVDYAAFSEAGLADYENEFTALKQVRAQINQLLFRNIRGGK